MKTSMKKAILLFLVTAAFAGADASWYWPFGDEEKDEKEKPRLSALMEPASLLIDDASDLAMDGKVTEAIAKYREALAALDKVEAEHPDRVQSPEFATLRNKRAYVNAAMDSIVLAQARQNAKSVAVSDTTELERKFAEEKAALERKKLEEKAASEGKKSGGAISEDGKKPDSEKASGKEEKPAGAEVKPAPSDADASKKTQERISESAAVDTVNPAAAPEKPKLSASAASSGAIAEKVPSEQPKSKRGQAIRYIQAGDYDAAMLVIDEMLAEKPNGAAALNLRAVCQVKQGLFKDAERTLDRAIRSNPRDFNAYYNMAYLVLQTRRDGGKNIARRYYETGRAFGGPVDERLKEAVK